MTLDIDPKALEFIRGKGGVVSTVETYPHQNSYAEIPITVVSYAAPASSVGYHVFEEGGVRLYIGKNIFFQRDLIRIRLGRFLCFRWLEWPTRTMFNTYG
jgi:hypothetical protein